MFWNKHKGIKVAVGMSGGVDSSVAAALLKKRGYEVIGIFMKYWAESEGTPTAANKCCSVDSFEDGRRVSDILGIPIYTYNFREPFKETIVQNFIDEYKAGNTPNPCIRCNELIKFGLFYEKARALGCDYIATGHYARLKKDWKGNVHLFEARDEAKDQTYFLYRLKQDILQRCLFPLGGMKKPKVRALAKKWGIPTFNKQDSQEICFVGDKKHYGFLSRHVEKNPGAIVDSNGAVLGQHEGLAFYTIGQRNRLELGPHGPWYVVGMNHEKNELVVSNDPNHPALYNTTLYLSNVTWNQPEPKFPVTLEVRIRYRHKGQKATITKGQSGLYKVVFAEGQRAITPGQSAVFYKGHEILGGGIITRQ